MNWLNFQGRGVKVKVTASHIDALAPKHHLFLIDIFGIFGMQSLIILRGGCIKRTICVVVARLEIFTGVLPWFTLSPVSSESVLPKTHVVSLHSQISVTVDALTFRVP